MVETTGNVRLWRIAAWEIWRRNSPWNWSDKLQGAQKWSQTTVIEGSRSTAIAMSVLNATAPQWSASTLHCRMPRNEGIDFWSLSVWSREIPLQTHNFAANESRMFVGGFQAALSACSRCNNMYGRSKQTLNTKNKVNGQYMLPSAHSTTTVLKFWAYCHQAATFK